MSRVVVTVARARASSSSNSSSLVTSRVAAARRTTRLARGRATTAPRGFDDIDIAAETADEDDYAKWQRAPESAAWKNYAESKPEGGSYVVGKRRLDEKFLSELMLALLRNHRRGIRAEAVLNKVKSNMELDGYKSVLVGIGRMEQWELAREVIDYVKSEGRERGDEVLTSNWFMALATRRLEEKAYDAACDVFDYMKEFGSVPSGETIEVFAKLTDAEPFMNSAQKDRVKTISSWLSESDAGQALWHIHFGDPTKAHQPGAPGTLVPDRTISVAFDSDEIDLDGDIEKLREKLKGFY